MCLVFLDTFQTLFRQDLLVASLLRNFLLAERIMRTYDCEPVSSPKLPPMHNHPMWQVCRKHTNIINRSTTGFFLNQTKIIVLLFTNLKNTKFQFEINY